MDCFVLSACVCAKCYAHCAVQSKHMVVDPKKQPVRAQSTAQGNDNDLARAVKAIRVEAAVDYVETPLQAHVVYAADPG